jgi:hypothetical protein
MAYLIPFKIFYTVNTREGVMETHSQLRSVIR